jgi:hypothetical protein
MSKASMTVTLTDNGDGDAALRVRVALENGFLHLYPEGYGEPDAARGHGSPVFMEVYDGRLILRVHPDITADSDKAVVIDLEGARENRITDWEDGK